MNKYILTSLLLSFSSFISMGLSAASESFCDNYAKLAVAQYKASQDANCNFSGVRWNDDIEEQKQWCLTVTEELASEETLLRAEALIQCKSKTAKIKSRLDLLSSRPCD